MRRKTMIFVNLERKIDGVVRQEGKDARKKENRRSFFWSRNKKKMKEGKKEEKKRLLCLMGN
jgi:hypothetical protein